MVYFNIVVSLILTYGGITMLSRGNTIGWVLLIAVPLHWAMYFGRTPSKDGNT